SWPSALTIRLPSPGREVPMPALLTSTSSRGSRSAISSAMRRTSSSEAKSARYPRTSAPVSDRRPAIVASRRSGLRPWTSTGAPSRASSAATPLLSNPRYGAEVSLHRWHPVEERWEAADAPLPQTLEEERAEHARREEEEREESREQGYPEWEVRLTLPNHREARALADRLESEGIPLVRLWRHLLI